MNIKQWVCNIIETIDSHDAANCVMQCLNIDCRLYIREYQLKLYHATHGTVRCPHCECTGYAKWTDGIAFAHYDEKPYLDESLEAPKINYREWFKLYTTLQQLEQNKKDTESMRKFQAFIDERKDNVAKQTKWLENLKRIAHDSTK